MKRKTNHSAVDSGQETKATAFDVEKLLANPSAFDRDGWQEFFKIPSLRVGVYVLPPGGKDTQGPHKEDEIYYAFEGDGTLVCETGGREERFPVRAGSVLFVPRETKHRFEHFPKGLRLLVFFSAA